MKMTNANPCRIPEWRVLMISASTSAGSTPFLDYDPVGWLGGARPPVTEPAGSTQVAPHEEEHRPRAGTWPHGAG